MWIVCTHRLCTSNQSNAPFIPRVVILGARGSGDQDQANSLARKYGAIAIHFQDVLQKAVDVGDAVSRTIKSSLKTGAPIPDSVLHALVAKEISQLACQTQGWVLTGYPKTGEPTLPSAAPSIASSLTLANLVAPAIQKGNCMATQPQNPRPF